MINIQHKPTSLYNDNALRLYVEQFHQSTLLITHKKSLLHAVFRALVSIEVGSPSNSYEVYSLRFEGARERSRERQRLRELL